MGQHFRAFQRLKTFNPQTNPPQERIRYLAFDKTGWCIGDCYFGSASCQSFYIVELNRRIGRIDWDKQCWRYSENERIVDIEVAFYAELPKVEI